MAGKLDAFLKLSIIASVLLASSSVAYYYAVYLPDRDARIDAATAAAEQRRAEEKTAAEQRRAEEKAAAEERRSEEQTDAQMRYNRCLGKAEDVYNSAWASNCSSRGKEAQQKHDRCIADPRNDKELCDQHYQLLDASANCALPRTLASDLEASLNKERERCLQASKAGL
jgi:hypothetical protein